jgi:hypothetical protein
MKQLLIIFALITISIGQAQQVTWEYAMLFTRTTYTWDSPDTLIREVIFLDSFFEQMAAEYQIERASVPLSGLFGSVLYVIGQQGWELAAISDQIYIFKRPTP